jgi:hypothetical protein
MSRYDIPYPSDFEVNHTAAIHEERRRRVIQSLDVGDVLAVVDDLLAQEPDPTKHPLFPVVNWLLDRQLAVHGGELWDAWKALACQAIQQLVEARLQGED